MCVSPRVAGSVTIQPSEEPVEMQPKNISDSPSRSGRSPDGSPPQTTSEDDENRSLRQGTRFLARFRPGMGRSCRGMTHPFQGVRRPRPGDCEPPQGGGGSRQGGGDRLRGGDDPRQGGRLRRQSGAHSGLLGFEPPFEGGCTELHRRVI